MSGVIAPPQVSEIEHLEADIQALEMVVREGQAERQRQESELLRLRAECSRWLSETLMLSEQLSVEAETRNQITRQYEIVRAELQANRVLPVTRARPTEKAIFNLPEAQPVIDDSQTKAA